jgi:hypothetical protein
MQPTPGRPYSLARYQVQQDGLPLPNGAFGSFATSTRGVTMLSLIPLLALAASEPAMKELPPVKEPDWNTWKDVDLKAKRQAMEAWAVLREHRPHQKFKTAAERREAENKVEVAYNALDGKPRAACATGSELLRTTKDDWERLMVATTVSQLGGERGEPFLLWAMAKSNTVDDSFEPIFEIACKLAAKRRPGYLPALFLMLRTHEGHIYLRLHSWYIRTHECLYYVFGRYGREVIPYLRPMLQHKDAYVRRNAAIVLGFFMDKPSKPALLKLLEANDIGSGGAAFALGELGAAEAVKPVAQLLKNTEARTRFWAAYALYEIGSKDALPALVTRLKEEKDKATREEMQAAIEHLRSDPKPFGTGARKLGTEELRDALQAAKKANGLAGDVEAIAASAGRAELDQLEEIRQKTMGIPSDMGNKWFQRWTAAIKAVQRRLD